MSPLKNPVSVQSLSVASGIKRKRKAQPAQQALLGLKELVLLELLAQQDLTELVLLELLAQQDLTELVLLELLELPALLAPAALETPALLALQELMV
jgi:hypothetical protein